MVLYRGGNTNEMLNMSFSWPQQETMPEKTEGVNEGTRKPQTNIVKGFGVYVNLNTWKTK